MSESRRVVMIWIGITIAIMFFLPFAVAKLASECAGMALCMKLFLVINPLYSIMLGILFPGRISENYGIYLSSLPWHFLQEYGCSLGFRNRGFWYMLRFIFVSE